MQPKIVNVVTVVALNRIVAVEVSDTTMLNSSTNAKYIKSKLHRFRPQLTTLLAIINHFKTTCRKFIIS
jgi:hypothetical protein